MKEYIGIAVLLFCFLGFSKFTHSQTLNQEKDYYNRFDAVTGIENSNLFEGILSLEKYATLNGSHEFYKSSDFLKGNIVYDGETYFNIDLKYDIYEDEVLLPLRSSSRLMMLELIKSRINEFVIDERRFVKVAQEEDRSHHALGFYEILKETLFFTLYKKHKKVRYPYYKKNSVFHNFVDDNEYFLDYGNHLYNIKNKKNLIKIFPQYKVDLNKHSIESLRKTDKDKYLTKLLDVIHNRLLSEKAL